METTSRSRRGHGNETSVMHGGQHGRVQFIVDKHRFVILKCFLVAIMTSLVLSRIGKEATGRGNHFRKIQFTPDEHELLFAPDFNFDKPATHVYQFLNTRNGLGRKLTLAFGNRHSSPPKLDFGVCLLLILLSGQVELNPGPTSGTGSLNSSVFPCGYCDLPVTWDQCGICCDSCDLWFHKNCVDMGSHTFKAFSTTNVSWICCNCDNPNFDRNLFHSFQIETANSFHHLNLSDSFEIGSPNSDFEPALHSSPIITRRQSKKTRNWRTLIVNCRSLRGKVEAFQSSIDYFQPDCILGTESWLDKSVSSNEIFPPGYQIFRRDRITSTQGGGVFIAIKQNYSASLLPDTETDCEILWTKVQFEKSLILGAFYRPPGSKMKKMEEFNRSSSTKFQSNRHTWLRL